jgi:hypothetical protein
VMPATDLDLALGWRRGGGINSDHNEGRVIVTDAKVVLEVACRILSESHVFVDENDDDAMDEAWRR